MITVLKVNKDGKKIVSYTCTDGNKTLDLTKEQLSNYISAKQVSNATQQTYKGTLIIRVKEANNNNIPKNNMNMDSNMHVKTKEKHIQNTVQPKKNNTKPLLVDRNFVEKLMQINKTAELTFIPNTCTSIIQSKAKMLNLDVVTIEKATAVYDSNMNKMSVYYDGNMLLSDTKFKQKKTGFKHTNEDGSVTRYEKMWPIALDGAGRIKTDTRDEAIGVFQDTDFKIIDISKLDNRNTKYITRMFDGCSAQKIILCETKFNSLIDVSYAFTYCKNLSELDLSNIDFETVRSARGMLKDSIIVKLNLGKFNINPNLLGYKFTDNMLSLSIDCTEIQGDNIESDYILKLYEYHCKNSSDYENIFNRQTATNLYNVYNTGGAELKIAECEKELNNLKAPIITGYGALETVYKLILEHRSNTLKRAIEHYKEEAERLRQEAIEKEEASKREAELDKTDPRIELRYYSSNRKAWCTDNYRLSETPRINGSEVMHKVLDSLSGQLTDGMWENSRDGLMMGSALHYNKEHNTTFLARSIWRDMDEARKYYARKLKECVKQEFKDESLDPVANWNRTNQLELDYLDCTVAEAYQAYDELLGRNKRN